MVFNCQKKWYHLLLVTTIVALFLRSENGGLTPNSVHENEHP